MSRLIDADDLLAKRPFAICGGDLSEYDEGYLDAIADAVEAVKHAPAIEPESLRPRWIPVTERLPEANENVLVSYVPFTADETGKAGLDVSIAFLGSRSPCGRWYWGEYEGEELTDFVEVVNEITHWMLLPEPPEVNKP